MKADHYLRYHQYLLNRSTLGNIYRKYILYPLLAGMFKGHVVDVGCGIGSFLDFYKDAEGLDINPYNVKFCQENGLKVTLIEKNGRFPYQDQLVENFLLDNVLEHIHDPRALLEEISRCMKLGGRFIVGVPGIKGFDYDDDHKKFYDKELLISTIAPYGFQEIKSLGLPLPGSLASKYIRQYCIYAVFKKIDLVN
tara:strand:- start:14154 stop:14738 length:585 start_codon:yes stop_codon:yes gene_type:complete